MDIDTVIEWGKNMATESSKVCHEAEIFHNKLKRHHANMAVLLSELQQLKGNPETKKADLGEVFDTMVEVAEAIAHLTQGTPLASVSIEDVESSALASEEGMKAQKELSDEEEYFLKKYFHYKSQLGLKTQVDVERLTGIDRRYISLIERNKVKVQFKTIKKIADGFGVDISEFQK